LLLLVILFHIKITNDFDIFLTLIPNDDQNI